MGVVFSFGCCLLRFKRGARKAREDPNPLGYEHDGPEKF